MDRLLHRPKREFSSSTGVCEGVVIVNVDTDNPSTFHAVSVIDSNTWDEVTVEASVVRQMNEASSAASPPEQAQPKVEETTNLSIGASDIPLPQSASSKHNAASSKLVAVKSSTGSLSVEMINLIDSALKKHGSLQKIREGFSLYLRDAGGQVEFQESMSLLVFGPSLFFFVFRVDLDFQSKFSIEYRVSESKSTNCYTSSITTEEAFLQCLASVHAMDTAGKAGVKTHKPFVFIVGTHKDKLGPSADEKIANLDEHLDSLILKHGFEGLVQYANGSNGQVMFAVDNMSQNEEDFKSIRSRIHTLISGREEFTIQYPTSYLLFCLELQDRNCNTLNLDDFKAMAAKCGIVGDQVSHLLQFLHLRIGIIQYFDVDGVRHIVLTKPQILFKKVTHLIIETFSSEVVTTKECKDFRKGILTASVLRSVIGNEDGISCEEFLKFMLHLRIITPYPSTLPGDQEERYFIPCVLNRVEESVTEDQHTEVLPLAVKFQCAHCPKGLFGILITHLMTPESDEKPRDNHISFRLVQDEIFKDQVSFEVHSGADQDKMSLKMFPSHLEIKFFPAVCEDRDLSIDTVCSIIRQIIDMSMLRSIQDLHYGKENVNPMMCFRCERCSELHQVKKGVKYHKMSCTKANESCRIPLKGRCWYNEGVYVCSIHKIYKFEIVFASTGLNIETARLTSAVSNAGTGLTEASSHMMGQGSCTVQGSYAHSWATGA